MSGSARQSGGRCRLLRAGSRPSVCRGFVLCALAHGDSQRGFERTPRTDAKRQRADEAVTRLRAADGLFCIDAAAGCTLGTVVRVSPVLNLVVASCKFRWDNGKFAGMTEPSTGYHGVKCFETFGDIGFTSDSRCAAAWRPCVSTARRCSP